MVTMITMPKMNSVQNPAKPAPTAPDGIRPMVRAPNIAPMIVPTPPQTGVPPTKIAAKTGSR
jgi:hypothetical protein